MQSVFKEIAGDFERKSEHRLIIDHAMMGAINQRVLGGETADLVIGSTPSISNLVKEGRIHAAGRSQSVSEKPPPPLPA